MVFSSGNVEASSTVWTEFDEVLLDPLNDGLLVPPPPPRLGRDSIEQPVQPNDQPVCLGGVPVNALRSNLCNKMCEEFQLCKEDLVYVFFFFQLFKTMCCRLN